MWFFDFFTKKEAKEKPKVFGFSVWGALLNYDMNYEVYYKYYNLNPFIFASINKRSNDVWRQWFELTKWWKKIVNEEFENLIKTSTSPTTKEFIKRLVRDYDISWNCYIYIVKDEKFKKAIWMQILDPRYIKPIADQFWNLIWYIQNLNWIRAFLPDELFHLKNDNDIENELLGKSRMTSLFLDVETDLESRDSNLAFFKNNQTPSSIVMLDKDFDLWDLENQWKLKKEIKDMFEWWKYVWWKNKHRSSVIQWVTWILKLQDKISDMEFLAMRTFTRDLVFAIYETPWFLFWYTENTNFSNGSNLYDIYIDTIENEEEKFWSFLEKVLKIFDERYTFNFLKDNLRKLRLKSDLAWSLYKDKELLTLDEAREIIQYTPVEWWSERYKNSSITINPAQNNKNSKK